MNEKTQKAIEILKNGGIVIFPTDTAFGIGCRIDRKDAVQKLFKIRKRPESQATPILVSSEEMASEYLTSIPNNVKSKLMDVYWPGALTIVLNCKKEKVPELVRGGGDTLGVRMPDSNEILDIIGELGVPILAPSANFHNDTTPFKLKDLNPELIRLVDYVLEGKCKFKAPSTVVDCTKTPWQVLRKGAVEVNI